MYFKVIHFLCRVHKEWKISVPVFRKRKGNNNIILVIILSWKIHDRNRSEPWIHLTSSQYYFIITSIKIKKNLIHDLEALRERIELYV